MPTTTARKQKNRMKCRKRRFKRRGNDGDDDFDFSDYPPFRTKSNLSFIELFRFGRIKGS